MKSELIGINSLESRLVNNYEIIARNQEYGDNTRVFGEIDFYAFSKGKLLIFEYKSHHTPKLRRKAIKQLVRADDKFVPMFELEYNVIVDKTYLFYVAELDIERIFG